MLITAFYAWVTYKILRANEGVIMEMRQQARAMARPYIVVAPILEFDNPIFYLRIKNSGKTAALNLRLTIDKPFFRFGDAGKDLSKVVAFNQPIDSFPPDAEIIFSLAQGFKIFALNAENENIPHKFSVTAQYEFDGSTVTEVNNIDLRPYMNADIPQDAYVRKLSSIDDSLKKVAAYAAKAV